MSASLGRILKSKTTTTPPGSPTNGDDYYVPAGASGVWASHVGELASYVTILGGWIYSPMPKGGIYFVEDDTLIYVWTGAFTQIGRLSDIGVLANLTGLTTAGDIIARNATVGARFPIGASDGMVLRVLASAAEKMAWQFAERTASFGFYSAAATAVNGITSGHMAISDSATSPKVPTGKSLKVLGAMCAVETGATDGVYDIELLLRNVTDFTVSVMGTGTYTVSGGVKSVIDIYAAGTLASPLATLAEAQRFQVGWRNKSTSVAALSAVQKTAFMWGVFV